MKQTVVRSLIACAAVVMARTCAFADWVSDEAILEAASAWLSSDRVAKLTMKGLSVKSLSHRESLRVVHLSPTGYVVFSGSDTVDPVISFSSNDFQEPDVGSPFYDMLEHSSNEVSKHESSGGERTDKWKSLVGGRDGTFPSRAKLLATAVEPSTILIKPFMTMHWNQGAPWNDFAPLWDSEEEDHHCVCGCVATAAAQQIAYCRWPYRTGRSDTWVHTLDADGEIESDGRYAESEYIVRFDGHLPFDWDSFLEDYYGYWGDVRGKIRESERFPIARFISWVDVITKMNFGKDGSGANFGNTGDSTTDWYEKWEECNLEHDNAYGVARIKADLEFGVPVHVGVPGHSVIAHGFASDGETDYLYLNYGWGNSSADGWYRLYGDSPIGGAFPGFRPKKMVQLEPLPKVSDGNVEVKWHLPWCYDNAVRGFEVKAIVFGDSVSNEFCDFSMSLGTASSPKAIYATNNVEGVGNDTDMLWWDPCESGTYDIPGERMLTARSVLAYRLQSAQVGDGKVEILASFDSGDWQVISTPLVNKTLWSDSWIVHNVFLGNEAGKIARFRIRVSRTGGGFWGDRRLLFDDFGFYDVIVPFVFAQDMVGADLRTHSLAGFGEGNVVGVSVKPLLDGDDGMISECQYTRISGPACVCLPDTNEAYSVTNLAYASGDVHWSLRGTAEGGSTIKAFHAWAGGFDVPLPGMVTDRSSLSFSWYETGCYALDSEYDTITATFVDDSGEETDFWCITNQNQQTERQPVDIPLSRFAGKSGGIKVVFWHSGANYVGDGDIMRFYSPVISNIAVRVLPEIKYADATFRALPQPQIISVTGHDGLEIDEGFYRECEIGEDSLRVVCSPTVTSLAASPSHLSLMDDDDVSVTAVGNGVFDVSMDTSKAARRSRMILTLAATDVNGTTVYRDVSLRFDDASAVNLIDGWRAMDSSGFKPVNAFTFDKSTANVANGPIEIGGGNVSYVESPFGYALYHNGDDGPWTTSKLNLPEEWTVLAIARMSDVNNAVLFQFGSSGYDQSGFALASGGKDRVTLSHWLPHMRHVDLLSVAVSDASSQYHAYAVRAHGKSVELFVDGVFAGSAALPAIPAVGFQLFSLIQGNGDTGLTNAKGEYMEDWRMYDKALPESMIARHVNLLADFDDGFAPGWRINVVTFDPNGGVVSETVRTIIGGAAVGDLPKPTRGGHVFVGWYTAASGGDMVTDATIVSGDTTYYARWTVAPTYTVTYNPGTYGTGTEQSATKTKDVALTLAGAIFTREGFTQSGWATSDGGANTYGLGASYEANADITLYPFWTANETPVHPPSPGPSPEPPAPVTYTVTYSPGVFGMEPEQTATKTKDVALTLADALFTREGFMQTGWATKDGGSKAYVLGASYTANAAVTLYPYWKPVYTVTYKPGAYGIEPEQSATKTKDVALTLAAALFTREGFTQTGWATSDGGAKAYDLGASYAVNAALALYPYWTKDASPGPPAPVATICTVKFNANGGSVSPASRKVTKGNAVGTLPKATRKGYTLKGWYTKKSGGSKVKTSTKVKKSVTYYAHWTANKYKIKFSKNGGKGTMKTQSATYGKKVTLRANAFKKSKYKFTGWAKTKNGKVKYKNKAKVKNLTSKNGKTVTLYAVWKKSK